MAPNTSAVELAAVAGDAAGDAVGVALNCGRCRGRRWRALGTAFQGGEVGAVAHIDAGCREIGGNETLVAPRRK